MGKDELQILIIDGEVERRESLEKFLRGAYQYAVDTTSDAEQAMSLLTQAARPYRVVVIGDTPAQVREGAPAAGAVELADKITSLYPQTEVILITDRAEGQEASKRARPFHLLDPKSHPTELLRAVTGLTEAASPNGGAQGNGALDALLEASRAVSAGRDDSEVFKATLQAVRSIGLDRARLYLPSDDGAALVCKAESGMGEDFVGTPWVAADDERLRSLWAEPSARLFDRPDDPRLPGEQLPEGGTGAPTVFVPLLRRGEPLGALVADNARTRRTIGEDVLRVLPVFASQLASAALADDNARLHAEAEQLEALRRTTLAIISPHSRRDLLQAIIQQAVGLLKGQSGGVYEYLAERGELTITADFNREENVGRTVKVGEGMAGRLVQTGDPYMIVDSYNEWEGRAAIYEGGRLFEAVLEVPLRWQNKVIGVLYVDDVKGRRFTPRDASLLGLFADQAAIVLANAASSDKDRRRLERLQQMARATREIMSNLGGRPLDERLSLIARHATDILDAEVCGVLLAKGKEFLSLEASHGHREGHFQKGRQFAIRGGPGAGLTGHIAWEGKLFNEHGDRLVNHPAVRHAEPDCTPSGNCHSLLAIPLRRGDGGEERLVGMLRASNKRSAGGRSHPGLYFTEEDEWILRVFAEMVVIAIENAELVSQLQEQRDRHGVQKDYLARLVDSSPNGIIGIDRFGHLTSFNERAREVLGYRADELRRAHVSQLYYDPNEARRIGKLLHQSPDGKLRSYDTFLCDRERHAIPVRLSATWLYDSRQGRTGSVGYFEDLRQIHHVEKRLEMLAKVNGIVAQAEDLSGGLQQLAQIIVALLGNAFCRLILSDGAGGALRVEAAYPVSREDGSLNWTHGRGQSVGDAPKLYEQVLRTKEPVVLAWSDVQAQPLLKFYSGRLNLGKTPQSVLLVPLMVGEECVGVLEAGEMRTERRTRFTPDRVELARTVAAQVSFLVRRVRLFKATERRRKLLASLDEKSRYLRGEKDLSKLQHEFVRLAVELVGGTAGALFTNYPHLKKVDLSVAYELPLGAVTDLAHGSGLVGAAASAGEPRRAQRSSAPDGEDSLPLFDFGTAVAVPLKHAGDVTDVLLVTDDGRGALGDPEIEALERFAAQASIAMQTSRQINSDQFTRHLNVLYQISEYILSENDLDKILDAVLTGITAGYGLGFNRAALLLLDERKGCLVGRHGIGHLEKKDWDEDVKEGPPDFKSFINWLRGNPGAVTPVGRQIGNVCVPVSEDGSDAFSRVIYDPQSAHLTADELNSLPRGFAEVFKPSTELVITPIATKEKVTGLVVVDNKFTQAPVVPSDIEALLTFVNTAALAIDNYNLFRMAEAGREQLRSLFEASNALTSAQEARLILREIVERTRSAAGAASVIVILVDDMGRARELISSSPDTQPDLGQVVRPGGIAMQVLMSGRPQIIEDSHQYRGNLNPVLLEGGDTPTALLCLPLKMQGHTFGVMWIRYEEPRTFTESEVEALKLYVNQAAIAYDNAHRIEELEHMRQAAEALAGATDDPQGVLKQIVRSARTVLQADSAVIWPYDDKSNSFLPDDWVGSNIPTGIRKEFTKAEPRVGGTAYTVMRHKWIGVKDVEDVKKYEFLGESTRALLGHIGAQSFLGISLTVGDEVLGVLYINYNQPRSFSEEEQQTARTFANHAALALKKAKLLDEVRRAKRAAEALAKVSVLGDKEATLRRVASETREVLDCDAVVLFEYDGVARKLHHPPHMVGVRNEAAASREDEVQRDSIVYTILEMTEPVMADDVYESELFNGKRFAREEGIRSCVGIPLRVGAQKVGVMFVNYRRPHHFTQEETNNVTLFASHASIAISNAQMFDRRAKQLKEQGALVKLSKELLGTISLRDTMHRAVHLTAESLDAEFCNIVLPAAAGDLVFSASYGWSEEMIGNFHVGGGSGSQTGYTIQTGEPVPVDDYADELPFSVPPIVGEYGIKSGLSVPMISEGKVIGAMLAHSKTQRHWTGEEINLASLIANQTAIAMRSARQYEQIVRKSAYLKGLYEAGRTITASFGQERKRVLDYIVREAVRTFESVASSSEEKTAIFGSLQLYDADTDEMSFESIFPRKAYPHLLKKIGNRWRVRQRAPGDRGGVTGRVVLTGQTQLVADVSADPDYVHFRRDTRSELAVPLRDKEADRVIGVLNLESNRLAFFTEEGRVHLEALAEMAVIAIKNARLYEELKCAYERLKHTQGLVIARSALAWMGMVSSAWRHSINGFAQNIRNKVDMTQREVQSWRLSEQRRRLLETKFAEIDSQASKIIAKKTIPPLSSEEGIESTPINELIGERVTQLWNNEPHSEAEYRLDLEGEDVRVRLSPEWFRRALDILVDNAVESMDGLPRRLLTIRSRVAGQQVRIEISDTGGGMPAEVKDRIFKEPIMKPEGQGGFGIGLLMVQAIVNAYSGEIELKESGHDGTTFVVTFPVEV